MDSEKLEDWIRTLNDRWLVQSNLASHANAYMNHLSAVDPSRLRDSCQIVRKLMISANDLDDPKPRFYGALFSLARDVEKAHYLPKHIFTRLLIGEETPGAKISKETGELILELRAEIQQAVQQYRRLKMEAGANSQDD